MHPTVNALGSSNIATLGNFAVAFVQAVFDAGLIFSVAPMWCLIGYVSPGVCKNSNKTPPSERHSNKVTTECTTTL